MPSDAVAALQDIQRHIDLATRFAQGLSYETFRDDARTLYAVTRCLEIIASRRLNVYRHEYEDVAAKLVWDTLQLALPPLRDVVTKELAALQ